MPSFRLGIEEHMHNLWGWECRNWKAFRAKGCPYLATVYSVVPKWRFALKELIGKYLSYVVFELPRLSMYLKYPWQDVTVNHHCQLDRFRISMETPPDVYEDVSTEGRHPGCVPQHHSGVGWSWTGRGEGCEGELSASLSFCFLTLNAVSPLPDALLPQLGPLEIMCLSLPSQWTSFPLRLGSKINMSSSCFCSGILSQLGRKVASPLSRGSKSPGGRPGCW